MHKLLIKISFVILVILSMIMIFSAATSKAANGEDAGDLPPVMCNLWAENIYGREDQTLRSAMDLYHKTINERFNDYTKLMIQGQTEASKSGKSDPNSRVPDDGKCDEKNYSTYCVGEDLLTNPRYGYMNYMKALECRKNRIFDTVTEEKAWDDYQDAMIIGEENEQDAENALQLQRSLSVSSRMEAAEKEIGRSKRALDTTLATYDELKTAWFMHLRYVEIYKNLVKFRDKMAEIRHQVEDFPSKFIDATTTMCT